MTIETIFIQDIAQQLHLKPLAVEKTLHLLQEGATIPFIARYRKEATESLDEVAIASVRDLHLKLIELQKRREAILASLAESGQLTENLKKQLATATTLTEVEDIYLPFRPKRKTRASVARDNGLEPLALALFNNRQEDPDHFLNLDKGITSVELALQGAQDIVAEMISEMQEIRSALRRLFQKEAVIESKVVKKNIGEAEKYRDYFDWQEPVTKAPSHRLLAMFRGESEKLLTLTLQPSPDKATNLLTSRFLIRNGRWQRQMAAAINDSYQRLLAPSLENELRRELKSRADEEAIAVFAANLRELLLASPLGRKRTMALDPGYRTGAKLVCLDAQGNLLATDIIYPTMGEQQRNQAAKTVIALVAQYQIEAIAIGNGTAGRETEEFIRSLVLAPEIIITLVNEDGASVYSASESARKEFPDHDITVRGAVSIGRRLQDPLAELVKIDPKAIGVGQYQHDVNQAALKKSLDEVVESCVNQVGVELNSASVELLTYVAGLGPTLAANIVAFRQANGPFTTRQQLLKVPRLGPKAFEQCAGFLRIHGGKNPLDASGVHPERYDLVSRMAKDLAVEIKALVSAPQLREKIDIKRYVTDDVGIPTLQDIIAELAKPGRDPRQQFEQFHFAAGIHTMEDLRPGMQLPAIITNVTKFGAFADIGIKQNGLIHISQLADRYVKDPSEVVRTGQKVTVKVIEIDIPRGRIGLSMRTR